jgi:site-specific DNA-methyltransferase (adenine-specific)
MFSSKNNCWCTPRDFYDKLNAEFNFTLDPCATEKSALCKKFFTPEIDGLVQDWRGHTVFCNPPYGREISKWVKKSYDESQKENTVVVMLIPAWTDTKYFHDYILGKAEVRFIKGRLKFIDLETEKRLCPAPFPSMVVVYR